ncbi:MAG: 3-deoxy-8-phosphooctulonate synthase [Candidatus Ratteibacteria bacterium]|jgi:2-dehydro-3-deoxyphosphooctonate aldolase (KDO 8-P synthase)
MNTVAVGDIRIGEKGHLVLIAGPCVIENEKMLLRTAESISAIALRLGISFIFKSSFDKANRSSGTTYRGPGIQSGLQMLKKVKETFGIPVLTDIHSEDQVSYAAELVDILQIPAFLCRQTDLLLAAGRSRRPINIKKGQFMSPWEIENAVEKVRSTGNQKVMVTERGTSFGYNNLVVDFRSLPIIRGRGIPLIFDGTHSVQQPGKLGERSGGQREFVPALCRAAVAVGCDGLFLEVHPDPDNALSDGPNMVPLGELESLLKSFIGIHKESRRYEEE